MIYSYVNYIPAKVGILNYIPAKVGILNYIPAKVGILNYIPAKVGILKSKMRVSVLMSSGSLFLGRAMSTFEVWLNYILF